VATLQKGSFSQDKYNLSPQVPVLPSVEQAFFLSIPDPASTYSSKRTAHPHTTHTFGRTPQAPPDSNFRVMALAV
jgi:hypothetical protein